MMAESLAQAAAEYLTIRLGPVTLAPVETSIVVMALAAALLAGFNLWRIGRREERLARLAALRVGVLDPVPAAGDTRVPWYRRFGGIVAASPIVGASDRERLLALLDAAGIRTHGRLASVVAAKVCAAAGLAALTWICLEAYQLLLGLGNFRLILPFAGFMLGWRLPDIILGRIAARRRLRLEFGMPDALDLLVVCAEAGLSLNQAIDEVSRGLRSSNSIVAEEFAITAAEMRVQADVEAVIDNMVRRTGLDSLSGIMSTLKQSLRFGTPLADSLRLLASEMRITRQARMEERAARLPVLLAIPIMLFILPSLLMVIGTPVALRVMDTLGSVFGPLTSGGGRALMSEELARIIDRRVARRIRERRLGIGMTQHQLARIIGVAFQQAHKYERGISRVSAGRLYHIATALRRRSNISLPPTRHPKRGARRLAMASRTPLPV